MKKFDQFVNESSDDEERSRLDNAYNNRDFINLFQEKFISKYTTSDIYDINFTQYKTHCCILFAPTLRLDLVTDDYSKYTVSGSEYMYYFNEVKEYIENMNKFTEDYKDTSINFYNFKEGYGRKFAFFIPLDKFEEYFKEIINSFKSIKGIKKFDL